MTQCKNEGYRAGMLAASEIANDFAIKCGAEAARYRAFANVEGSRAGSENMMERAIARTQCEGVAGGIAKTIRDIALNISAVSSPDNIDDLVSIFLSATSWTRQADTSVEAGLSAVLFAIGCEGRPPSKTTSPATAGERKQIARALRSAKERANSQYGIKWHRLEEISQFELFADAILAARPSSDALQAENERLLREALEPFVAHWQPWMADDYEHPNYDEMSCFARVTYGDLRRARAALTDREAGK